MVNKSNFSECIFVQRIPVDIFFANNLDFTQKIDSLINRQTKLKQDYAQLEEKYLLLSEQSKTEEKGQNFATIITKLNERLSAGFR